ncbi:AAA family ATPase [Flavobacterium sp. MDT1-60]|uniref:AAA family ATPase n=1 Tax=Flavobacterium sp. MDT1-60 TaxID=1979344 RepID=UPI00177CC198|nr:AAA family ATPase [Flavobacterium sp. MDT1-60]QOG03483.1 AAA family ATPase [Flavobacterium sp. MDT1-60]
MKIKVVNWCSHKIQERVDKPEFVLERDSWNDFNYHTYYYLHTRLIDKNDNYTLIGGVRILKKGQKPHESYLINEGIIENPLDDFCSLGGSLDYYERMSQLEDNSKEKILDFLNDIIKKPEIIPFFSEEQGFTSSLMRDITFEDDLFHLAPIILTGKYDNLPSKWELDFSFISKEMKERIVFDFSSKEYLINGQKESLPNRICVIIGRNGSGKSTLLSKIARLVFSSAQDRIYIKEMGTIEPLGLGFPRIINLSYSAFDSFQVPGITFVEKKQICEDINNNKGRYIYCGVRDISKEVEEELKILKSSENGRINLEDILNDKYEFNFLKSLSTIESEFLFAWNKILETYEKTKLLNEALELLSQEASLNFLSDIKIEEIRGGSEESFFKNLSTGHKFVIHSIFKLIYHIQKRSLILFDEPESHLHPPLLAVLMKVLRHILDEQSSFMIITTHSPVAIQETLQKHVIVIRREGNSITTFHPENQTFGESIGSLTSDIFGLSSDYKDYHEELDKIVDSYKGDINNFENYISYLFDSNISSQAYAYMHSKFHNKTN